MLHPKSFHFSFFFFFLVLHLLAQEKQKSMPFKKIIIEIEQQHKVSFNYTEDNITGLQLHPPKRSLSLDQKLQYLERKTNLSFENIGNQFINIYKKDKEANIICGYVFSADKKPIENANINLNDKIQLTTDANGYFEGKKSEKNMLWISHVGYITKRIVATNSGHKKCLEILLDPDITELEEIKTNAIFGFGNLKK